MAEMDEIRLEALKGITILATHDDQFRRGAVDDLEGTLRRYGFDLTEGELERLRSAQEEVAGRSDEDIAEELRSREARLLTREEERVADAEYYVAAVWY